MKRVIRVLSAVSAGASLAWGIAKALRKGRKSDAPPWEAPKPEAAKSAASEPPVKASAPAPKAVEPPKAPEAPKAAEAAAPPEPVEATEPAPAEEETVIKGVVVYHPDRLIAWVNGADEDALKDAGLKGKALSTVLESRPFGTADDIGSTSGIGRRTLQALCAAADA
ncbi:MAG: hypothetical protein KC656_15575 [Myxococcales bacterium]|nr:hypothetical protein [Myxococcales bacterium]